MWHSQVGFELSQHKCLEHSKSGNRTVGDKGGTVVIVTVIVVVRVATNATMIMAHLRDASSRT
jgi:hypothetical protein